MLIHLNERFQHWQSGYDDSVGLSEFIYCFHKCVLFVSYISKHYKLYQTISIGRYSTWHSFESFLNWNRNQHSPEGPWLHRIHFRTSHLENTFCRPSMYMQSYDGGKSLQSLGAKGQDQRVKPGEFPRQCESSMNQKNMGCVKSFVLFEVVQCLRCV